MVESLENLAFSSLVILSWQEIESVSSHSVCTKECDVHVDVFLSHFSMNAPCVSSAYYLSKYAFQFV